MKPIKSVKLTILPKAKSACEQAYQLGRIYALTNISEEEEKYRNTYNR